MYAKKKYTANSKNTGMTILTSDKIDIRKKITTTDNERNYKLMKGTTQEKNTSLKIFMHLNTELPPQEANIYRMKPRDRQFHSHSFKF